jgi:hypothetical protein
MSPRLWSHVQSSRHALSPLDDVPVSFGSSPITTSIAAPARKPTTTAFDRNCAIQPMWKTARSRNRPPVTSVIAATSSAAFLPVTPVASTAPPATAASDDDGPVEM